MGAINQDNVYVYPNPSSDGVFYIVDAIGNSAIVSGSVMDIQGKEVARFFPEQSIVHIGDKAPGMYLLRYIRSNGSIGTVKLIK